MRVARVVLTRHGREGIAPQVSPVTREPCIGVVVVTSVEAVARHPLLLELHQALDLVVWLWVRASTTVVVTGVRGPGQLSEVKNFEAFSVLVRLNPVMTDWTLKYFYHSWPHWVALCMTPLNTLTLSHCGRASYRWLRPPSRHQHLPPLPIPAAHWSAEQRGALIGRQAWVWPAGNGQILVGIIKISSAATAELLLWRHEWNQTEQSGRLPWPDEDNRGEHSQINRMIQDLSSDPA